ncbi:MAG TPA: ComEC/Rec2 family competence protein [Rhizomicrobium sp.]|nr:ComEC/Rec2 family competence protein [Rhizomicrobium sp.]
MAFYFWLPVEPALALLLATGSVGFCAAIFAAQSQGAFVRAGMAALAAVLIGFTVAKLRTEWVSAPVLIHKTRPTTIDARVESTQVHGKGVRIVLNDVRAQGWRSSHIPQRIRVSVRSGGEALVPDDWVQVRAVLMPPPGPAAPGAYDFGRAAYFDGIGAVGYTYGKPVRIASRKAPDAGLGISRGIEALRWRMTSRIHAVLPGSTGSIASALITGDRGGISDDDEQALRDAGLAHVLAIAGLHMALVGLGLFWVVRAVLALFPVIALNYPIKKWAALAALGGAGFYLVISGAGAASTRAFVMLAMMLLAILFDRPAISMRALALAATIILLIEPESIIEPGFQMSFAAVVALIAVVEWEQARVRTEFGAPPNAIWRNLRHYMKGIATTSFVGSIATLPYAIYHFDRATHYAVLGNLGAMPIMGFLVMPMAALSVIAMPFGLEAYPLHAMGWGIEAMLAVGRWVSGLPGAVSVMAAWPVGALAVMSLGGLWVALWRKPWRWFGLLPIAASVTVAFLWPQPDLLIARDAKTVAVRGSDGTLRFVSEAHDKYSAQEWLKRSGDARLSADAIAAASNGVRCDELGCIARAKDGTTVAIVSKLDALAEDCGNAQIVISAAPARGQCKGPKLVIDRFDVARNGAYAVWLGKNMTMQTAQDARGVRPWSEQPRRNRDQYRRSSPTSLP